MTASRLFAVCFLVLTFHHFLKSQSTFLNTYTTDQSSYGLWSREQIILSGGQIVLGGSGPIPGGGQGFFALLDGQGEVSWSKHFVPDMQFDFFQVSCFGASRDGNLFCAIDNHTPYIGFPQPLLKMGLDGQVIWRRDYRDTSGKHLLIHSIVPVTGGYLLSGSVEFSLEEIEQLAVFKIDENGNIIWQRSYEWYGSFTNAIEMPDGSLYTVGNTVYNPVLAHFSQNGDLLSMKRFIGISVTGLSSTNSGDLIFCGNTAADGGVAFRMNAQDSFIWQKQYPTTNFIIDMKPTGDDEYLVVANGADINLDSAVVFKINAEGDLLWAKRYQLEGPFHTYLWNIDPHPEGGFVLSGATIDTVLSKNLAFLLRANEHGSLTQCCREITLDLPVREANISIENFLSPPGVTLEAMDGAVSASDFAMMREEYCSWNLSFSLSDTTICPNQCIDIQFPSPTPDVAYTWTFEGGTPATSEQTQPGQVCFNNPAKNKALITLSADGCLSATDTLHIGKPEGRIPNAFTPDNDSTNDVFRPLPECPVEDYRFQVFDRWGNKAFDSSVPGEGWDGRVSGTPAPADVYVWQLEYVVAGAKQFQRGEVTLLR